MEENDENKNNELLFINSKFGKNIKDLFTTEYTKFYNKNRLNNKLKSIISKEKILNNRKIKDFDYSKMFHYFKVDMRKFEEMQEKKRHFYQTLNEENIKFNQDYQKSYSSKIHTNNINNTETNIKSKTFQKFYNKHKIKSEENSKKINNLFNRDPLLDGNNDINLFYANKDIENDYIENNNDESLNYINRLEENVNEKSILNKIKHLLGNKKKKNEKNGENNNEEDYYSTFNKTINNKKYRNTKAFIDKRNSIISTIKYNNTVKEEINKMSTYYKKRRQKLDKIYNLKKDTNKYKTIKIYSEEKNNKKKNKKINPNQIENLYNEIVRIKKNLKKYEKNNEKEIKYLYTTFSKNKGKNFKMGFEENKRLFNLDRKLVYAVNSFNE